LRFDCIRYRKATTKPQVVKDVFVRMLTHYQAGRIIGESGGEAEKNVNAYNSGCNYWLVYSDSRYYRKV